jgi:hypothetical protein
MHGCGVYRYRLSEELYQHNDEVQTSLFRPYIERLIEHLCKHCQMDSDSDGVVDDGDDFADFRARVSELIKDVVFIVGSTRVFTSMFERLRGSSSLSWEVAEAALFIMSAVARNIPPGGDVESNNCVAEVSAYISIQYSNSDNSSHSITSVGLISFIFVP